MAKHKPLKPGEHALPTLAQIAESLAISTRRVSQLKEEGMPVHSIEAAQVWRTEKAKESSGDFGEQLKKERVELVREQKRKVRYENEEKSGRLVSRQECREAWTRIGCAVAAMLHAAEMEIPRVCLGLPLAQSLPKAKEKMREIQATFANAESEFWKQHPEVDE